jgi:hypothetical protein
MIYCPFRARDLLVAIISTQGVAITPEGRDRSLGWIINGLQPLTQNADGIGNRAEGATYPSPTATPWENIHTIPKPPTIKIIALQNTPQSMRKQSV